MAIKSGKHKKEEDIGSPRDAGFANRMYRSILDNMLEGVQIIGFDWRYLYVNDTVARQGHYSKEELVGFTMMEKYPGIENTEMFDIMRQCMQSRVARRLENKFIYPDNTVGWFDLSMEPVPDGLMILSIDITERKKAEEDIFKLNTELDAKVKERTFELTESLEREKSLSEMKSRFVSMASHEFRTPLATILSSLALVRAYDKPEQQEIKVKHINRIYSSVRNLTDILSNFLSLAQLEKGMVEIDTDVFSLPEFLQIAVEEMDGAVSRKNQLIKYEHNGEDTIENSKKILKNIILNLLSNASKYSGEEKQIHLISSVNNDTVSITVRDQGIGIPEEDQKRLFDEFFRAGNVGDVQGTGLGLSIVKKYIELLDGNINFVSIPNHGTTFVIEFPQRRQSSKAGV